MKKIFALFVYMNLFLGCDAVMYEYLYDSSDTAEYAALKAMAAQKCIDDASIFDALDATGDFVNTGLLNKVYSITQDSAPEKILYMKISAVSATSMSVHVNSGDNALDKTILFEKTDHDSLLSELKIMACSLDESTNFSSSGLDSSDKMTLTWNKESISVPDSADDTDDTPEAYQRRTDTLAFETAYPLFFYFYNGSKVATTKTQTADEKSGTSKLVIKDVTATDICDASVDEDTEIEFDNDCNFEATTTALFPTCNLVINTGKYNSNAYTDTILSFAETTSCSLLTSAQI